MKGEGGKLDEASLAELNKPSGDYQERGERNSKGYED